MIFPHLYEPTQIPRLSPDAPPQHVSQIYTHRHLSERLPDSARARDHPEDTIAILPLVGSFTGRVCDVR